MPISRREMNRALTLGAAALLAADTAVFSSPQAAAQDSGNLVRRPKVVGKVLMTEPLAPMPNPEVSMVVLTVAPGEASTPHEHTGPVFAYVLEGRVENQVDPHPPQTYEAGQFFYEPPRHVHRQLRNLSPTKPAKLLVFQVGETGKPFTLRPPAPSRMTPVR